jgi:hypothetical protein
MPADFERQLEQATNRDLSDVSMLDKETRELREGWLEFTSLIEKADASEDLPPLDLSPRRNARYAKSMGWMLGLGVLAASLLLAALLARYRNGEQNAGPEVVQEQIDQSPVVVIADSPESSPSSTPTSALEWEDDWDDSWNKITQQIASFHGRQSTTSPYDLLNEQLDDLEQEMNEL